jgi:hypothetical protein
MSSRRHGLILSLLLGAATAAGSYAMIATAGLGDSETKPEVVSSRQITKRAHKLDAWEASLKQALEAKPPALAPLNRYAAATFVSGPGAASMPAVATPLARPKQQTRPASSRVVKERPNHTAAIEVADREVADEEKRQAPVAEREPVHTTPAPVLPVPAAEAAATPVVVEKKEEDEEDEGSRTAPSSSPPPPQTLSVEQQCKVLERAAEGRSEQVKKEAERQCEALKQAAERNR